MEEQNKTEHFYFTDTALEKFLTWDRAKEHPLTASLTRDMWNLVDNMHRISNEAEVPKEVLIWAEQAIGALLAAATDIDGVISCIITRGLRIPEDAYAEREATPNKSE